MALKLEMTNVELRDWQECVREQLDEYEPFGMTLPDFDLSTMMLGM